MGQRRVQTKSRISSPHPASAGEPPAASWVKLCLLFSITHSSIPTLISGEKKHVYVKRLSDISLSLSISPPVFPFSSLFTVSSFSCGLSLSSICSLKETWGRSRGEEVGSSTLLLREHLFLSFLQFSISLSLKQTELTSARWIYYCSSMIQNQKNVVQGQNRSATWWSSIFHILSDHF